MKPSLLINSQKDILLANLRLLRDLGGINQAGFVYLSGKLLDTIQACNTPESAQIKPEVVEHPQTGNTTPKQAAKLLYAGIKLSQEASHEADKQENYRTPRAFGM
jgi:hypothetical protein